MLSQFLFFSVLSFSLTAPSLAHGMGGGRARTAAATPVADGVRVPPSVPLPLPPTAPLRQTLHVRRRHPSRQWWTASPPTATNHHHHHRRRRRYRHPCRRRHHGPYQLVGGVAAEGWGGRRGLRALRGKKGRGAKWETAGGESGRGKRAEVGKGRRGGGLRRLGVGETGSTRASHSPPPRAAVNPGRPAGCAGARTPQAERAAGGHRRQAEWRESKRKKKRVPHETRRGGPRPTCQRKY